MSPTPKRVKLDGVKPDGRLDIRSSSSRDTDDAESDYVPDEEKTPAAPKFPRLAEDSPAQVGSPRGLSMNKKAIKAREKALVEKFAVVQANIQNPLEKDAGVVVNAFFHAKEKVAPMDKSFDYTHLVKLVSPMPFVFVKQAMLHEGPYAGHVAIIIKQSVPFPFMQLPKDIRKKVYSFLMKHDDDHVRIVLAQGNKKVAYSQLYKGKKNLAMLATCKKIRDEAAPIVYGQKFTFSGTQVITTWMLQIGQFGKFLKQLECDSYTGTSARLLFHMLVTNAPNVERLSFLHVSSNERPGTASKNGDAQPWLDVVNKTDPGAGLRILHFSNTAFHMRVKQKDGSVNVVQWGPGEKRDFVRGLQAMCDKTSRQQRS